MRTLKPLSVLTASSALQCLACQNAPISTLREIRAQTCAIASANTPTGLSRRLLSTSAYFHSQSTSASSPNFTYRIGASFSAKGRRFRSKDDIFPFDPQKDEEIYTGRPKSGQDAFFASNTGSPGNVAFGVADGVGGWSDSGIDSAHFSHGLCQKMARFARKSGSDSKTHSPRALLQNAYEEIVQDEEIEGGGSTACVAIGGGDGTLQVANLGDSGYIQLRLNAVHHFSNPQTHAFNTPYQLSVVPPKILRLNRLFGGKQLSDSPNDSNVASHQVRHGDVFIFATDGVWDNLSPTDILKIVSRQMSGFQAWIAGDKGTTVSETLHKLTQEGGIPKQHENTLQTLLAVNIVEEAKAASVDTRRDGPFAKEVQRHYPQENYHGGKVDDICVVVAVVVRNTEKP